MNKIKIELTPFQYDLIKWAIAEGYGQLVRFLRHDEWDFGMNKKEKHAARWSDRRFKKAIDLWERKGGE